MGRVNLKTVPQPKWMGARRSSCWRPLGRWCLEIACGVSDHGGERLTSVAATLEVVDDRFALAESHRTSGEQHER